MSADLYGTCVAFLPADIIATVNAEFPSLLAAGSVIIARKRRRGEPRKLNPLPVSIEITPVKGAVDKELGTGWLERRQTFDIEATVRLKAQNEGTTQLVTPEKIARSLVFHYNRATGLALTPAGAKFLVAGADVAEIDPASDAPEMASITVRAFFIFSEAGP